MSYWDVEHGVWDVGYGVWDIGRCGILGGVGYWEVWDTVDMG